MARVLLGFICALGVFFGINELLVYRSHFPVALSFAVATWAFTTMLNEGR